MLNRFNLQAEGNNLDDAYWPYTMPYEWCGQWGKAASGTDCKTRMQEDLERIAEQEEVG